MAVVVPYGDDDDVLSIEVVPAFDRDGGGYFIPDPDAGTWIATNPKTHHELSIAKNAECDGKYVPFVKMIKGINRELGEPVAPSFLLEVMAQDIVKAPFGRYPGRSGSCFSPPPPNASTKSGPDPAGLGGDVNTVMGQSPRNCLRHSRLATHNVIAERAVDLEDFEPGSSCIRRMEEAVGGQDHTTMTSAENSASAPRGVPPQPIEERQLEPDILRLQRAAARSHQRGQRLDDAIDSIRAAGISGNRHHTGGSRTHPCGNSGVRLVPRVGVPPQAGVGSIRSSRSAPPRDV